MMKTVAPLYFYYAELIPRLIIKHLIKKASTVYIVVMMEEIKPFVILCYGDKIEPEEADQKEQLFSAGKPFPHFTGVHCVCPANFWVKIGMSTILKGLKEIQILQVVKQQYCNCLIALSGHSRSQTWNWFTAKHSPREDRRIYFPLVCVSHHHQKNYSRLSMGE